MKALVQGLAKCALQFLDAPWGAAKLSRGATESSPFLHQASSSAPAPTCSFASILAPRCCSCSIIAATAQGNPKMKMFGNHCPRDSRYFMLLPPFYEPPPHAGHSSWIHERSPTSPVNISLIPEEHVEKEYLASGSRTKEELDQTKCPVSWLFCSYVANLPPMGSPPATYECDSPPIHTFVLPSN